jgi:hypothetical protein
MALLPSRSQEPYIRADQLQTLKCSSSAILLLIQMLSSHMRPVAAVLESEGAEHFFPLWPKIHLGKASLTFISHRLTLSSPFSSHGRLPLHSQRVALSHLGGTLPAAGHCSCSCLSQLYNGKANCLLEAAGTLHGTWPAWGPGFC